MRKKISMIMYLSFLFTGLWLAQTVLPVLKEDPWVISIK